MRPDTYQCHFDADVRHMIAWLYKHCGTLVMAIIKAPEVGMILDAQFGVWACS